MMESLVSVVMCTFNGEKYITEQIESVLGQSYKKLEVIVVDDCSTDRTVEIVKLFAEGDARLSIEINEVNLGYVKNFEKALRLANGDFIAPCDQDDWWHPEKIKILLDEIGSNDLIYCNSQIVDSQLLGLEKTMADKYNMYQGKSYKPFLINNCISGHASIITHSLLQRSLPFSEDIAHDWWLAIHAGAGNGIAYHPSSLIKYRFHQDNVLLGTTEKKSKTEKKVFKRNRTSLLGERIFQVTGESFAAEFSEAYEGDRFYCKMKRVTLALSNYRLLFYINKASTIKKIFNCFKLFFKLR